MIRPLFQSSECVRFGSTLIRMSNILIHPEAFAAKSGSKNVGDSKYLNMQHINIYII